MSKYTNFDLRSFIPEGKKGKEENRSDIATIGSIAKPDGTIQRHI